MLRDSVDAGAELQLCGCLNLCVHAADVVSDVGEAVGVSARGQEAAGKPLGANLVPRRRDQLEEPVDIEQLAADQPRERTALEDLQVRAIGILLLVILAVMNDPGPQVIL